MTEKKKMMDSPRRKGPDPRWIYPIRADVKCSHRDGIVVLEYPKSFSPLERKLHGILGGPTKIKRPLDDIGTLLWEMADGGTNLLEIYLRQQEEFHERVEPVDKVVGGLLETLLTLGLMELDYKPEGEKRAKRIVVREVEE
ncbi:MAG: hypothetical protein KAH57_11750 [Thermoplasmata archaeon]|nr:hypothetical protein [Thermoplasmata archaeon]